MIHCLRYDFIQLVKFVTVWHIAMYYIGHLKNFLSFKYYLNPTMSRLSLLLHESEAKLRTSVNNNDNLQV